MAAKKKATLKVVSDGVEVDGRWYHNGQILQVSQSKAKELLKTGSVVKAS